MNFSFHPSARTELNQAVDYYNDCEADLGYDFLQEVYATINRITQSGLSFSSSDQPHIMSVSSGLFS